MSRDMASNIAEERRITQRTRLDHPVAIEDPSGRWCRQGRLIDLSPLGAAIAWEHGKPPQVKKSLLFTINRLGQTLNLEGQVVWTNRDSTRPHQCGVFFMSTNGDTSQKAAAIGRWLKLVEVKNRRVPHNLRLDYTPDMIQRRRQWLEERTQTRLEHIGRFSVPAQQMQGNIEYPVGTCQIPVGVAGPLKMQGEHARGDFYIPLATTEGALVLTYSRGMRAIYETKGVRAKILRDVVHISPFFFIEDPDRIHSFPEWIHEHFDEIKRVAESTTRHGKLQIVRPLVTGMHVVLKFEYYTADAHGLNMVNKATEAACDFIAERTGTSYLLRSNYSSVKKVSFSNIYEGYGKAVFVDAVLSRAALKLLSVTPEEMCAYLRSCTHVGTFGGTTGVHAHTANAVTAMFIACGQDVADVSTSHVSMLSYDLVGREKDLYASLYLPNLLVGTVGGGTGLPTQRESLELLGCYGTGKARKFAELVAATALAGELAVMAAVIRGTYVEAHEKYGRNRPAE